MLKKNDEEELAAVYSDLVRDLDKWLQLLAKRGGSDEYIVKLATGGIRRNIKSNIVYYQALANDAEKANDAGAANHFRLIAKLYDAVCQN